MKTSTKKKSLSTGQGTLEYILLTALIVGVVLVIFNGPLKSFLAKYTSRKSQYSDVVSQRRLGIPMAWFGGNIPNPADSAGATGGATAGDADDPNAGGPSPAGTNTDPNANANGGATAGDTAGGDDPADGSGPARGPGGSRGSGNNLGSRDTSNPNNSRRGRGSGDETEDAEGSGGGGGGGTVGGGTSREGRGSGSVQNPNASPQGEDGPESEKVKKPEDGGALDNEKTLYGSGRDRARRGGCDDFDLKVILQIAFVIALLFLLASVLFQKRGRDD